jgi:hypothetical protein
MDIFGLFTLVVVILLALNHMAGGRPSNVLRPAGGIVGGAVGFAINMVLRILGSVGRLFGAAIGSASQDSAKKLSDDKNNGPAGRTPPRWD